MDTEQNAPCVTTRLAADSARIPAASAALDISEAWRFSRGAGQTVAVIDTGVAPHPRLPGLRGGGDFVAHSDGTEDCDGHGTAVAGLIGASPTPGQGFAGIAPDAAIVSIRQSSEQFQPKGAGHEKTPEDMSQGVGDTHTLAWAIRRAADMGATVINISEAACKPDLNDADVGSALEYAAVDKDAVVVVAAGNVDADNASDACQGATSVLDPRDPTADPWSKVTLNVSPARYDQFVLAVGSVDGNGQPSSFTVPGPWLGVAAPGEHVLSLAVDFGDSRSKGLADQFVVRNQTREIKGTSFAAPYVSGLAALVRAQFPQLHAGEVIERIEATAHAPAEGWNPYVGYGTIDPIAALTAQVPPTVPPKRPSRAISWQLPVAPTPPPADHTPRTVALLGTAVVAGLLLLGYLVSLPLRRRFGN